MNGTKFGLLKKFIVALVVVLLNFSRQIGSFLVEENRYYLNWRFLDGLAILLDVVVLAAVAAAISRALSVLKWDRLLRAYHHVFLLALGLGLVTLLPPDALHPDADSPRPLLVFVALVAVVAYSLGNPRSRLVTYGANLCLVFSPLVLILSFQLLSAATWATAPEPWPAFASAPADAPPAGGRPVFVFVFDELSYLRSTDSEGEFLPSLPNLRALSNESFHFRQANSHSAQTKFSLPAIVFQTDATLQIDNGQTFWESAGARTPTPQVPSLFAVARARGQHTALLGFYIPYRKMLGDQVEFCHAWTWYPKGDGLGREMASAAVRNLQYVEEPLSLRKRQAIQAAEESERFVEVNRQILDESLRLIRDCPRNTFAFFHWPLPHGPFVFNPDGSYRGPYTGRGTKFAGLHGTPEDYERNLLYADVVLGRLVEQIKRSGKYDDALIIVTADHGWRYDPDQDRSKWKRNPALRRVPLLVKLPGQKARRVIDRPVKNNKLLSPLIDHVLKGDVSEEGTARLIEAFGEAPPAEAGATSSPADKR